MANKWQIILDVTEEEVALLRAVLSWAAEKVAKPEKLDDLRVKIKLTWIERDVEIIPPPSKWSALSPAAVGCGVYWG